MCHDDVTRKLCLSYIVLRKLVKRRVDSGYLRKLKVNYVRKPGKICRIVAGALPLPGLAPIGHRAPLAALRDYCVRLYPSLPGLSFLGCPGYISRQSSLPLSRTSLSPFHHARFSQLSITDCLAQHLEFQPIFEGGRYPSAEAAKSSKELVTTDYSVRISNEKLPKQFLLNMRS